MYYKCKRDERSSLLHLSDCNCAAERAERDACLVTVVEELNRAAGFGPLINEFFRGRIAYGVAGSIEAFAELMNQKAAELGLSNTHFTIFMHGIFFFKV